MLQDRPQAIAQNADRQYLSDSYRHHGKEDHVLRTIGATEHPRNDTGIRKGRRQTNSPFVISKTIRSICSDQSRKASEDHIQSGGSA